VSAHKFGGPRGAGILLVPEQVADSGCKPGEQEHGRRGAPTLPNIWPWPPRSMPPTTGSWTAWKAASPPATPSFTKASVQFPAHASPLSLFQLPRGNPRCAPPSMLNASHGLHCAGLWNTVLLLMPGTPTPVGGAPGSSGFQASTGSACARARKSLQSRPRWALPRRRRRAVRFSAGPGPHPPIGRSRSLGSVWQELEAASPAG
jgi:hypothetical protein